MVHPPVSTVGGAGRQCRQVRERPQGDWLPDLRAHSNRPTRLAIRGSDEEDRNAQAVVTRILLSCGEASGDLYAGALVEALRRREPDVDVFGLGSEQFAAAGGRLIEDFHGLSVTGLTEAL